MRNKPVKVVLGSGDLRGKWKLFQGPETVITAYKPEDVRTALQTVQDAVENEGLYAAGFLCYEAASGLDAALKTHSGSKIPLVWFGLFRDVEETELPPSALSDFTIGEWQVSVSSDKYTEAIKQIKHYLKSGDTYQVNYTLRLRASFDGDPWSFFCRLARTQRTGYCAFIETEAFAICSASPELFFSLDKDVLTSSPMKGTSKRGLTLEQDRQLAEALRVSEKNRAENVMIVDMVRNDMGRIADKGSVHVPSMFDIEQYPTVLQMTSTVTSNTSASFVDIMSALFPCASITGAPKVRTMEIIKELESDLRGIYTGCVGYVLPGRKALFNVAIRTVYLDKSERMAEYGVGGGVVWDSSAEDEYEECRVKAGVLTSDLPDFQLLESLLWDNGCFLLEEHLKRLQGAAEYFAFNIDIEKIRKRLLKETSNLTGRFKIRLLVDEKGGVSIEKQPLINIESSEPWRVCLAGSMINSQDLFLYHKTTNRSVYEHAKSTAGDCDDVILMNERGQITESTMANIVVEKDGRRLTPPVQCGLLPGVFREHLLNNGMIEEHVIMPDDIRKADNVFLINSVRKWIKIKILF